MNYKQEAIKELSEELLSAGFRVFIAKSGEYGLFANDGSSVVSFRLDFSNFVFSGNHTSVDGNGGSVGTGWGFDSFTNYQSLLNAVTPQWVTKGVYKCKPTTLDEYLKQYNSSGFVEVFK